MVAQSRPTPRSCRWCGTLLVTRRQRWYCGPRCGAYGQWNRSHPLERGVSGDILAILRGNTDWWMTPSDLAIWQYGHDDAAELHSIRVTISRLRALGCIIESRYVPWAGLHPGMVTGYRLIEVAAQQQESA